MTTPPNRKRSSHRAARRAALTGAAALVAALAARADEPHDRSAVYELQADGTGWRYLFEIPEFASLGSPRCAPDGERLALDGCRSQLGEAWSQSHVLVCRLDGSDLRDLGRGAMPTWEPDCRRIACSRYDDRGVWLMDSGGEETQRIDAGGWGIVWSPTGSEVAYTRGGNVLVRDVLTGASRELFAAGESPYTQIYWNMTWSPDGKQIALLGRARPENVHEIAIVDAHGPELGFKVCVQSPAPISANLAWHPGGRRLVFPQPSPEHQVSQLYEVDPAGKDPPVLVKGQAHDRHNVAMCWTHDGARLIVISGPK